VARRVQRQDQRQVPGERGRDVRTHDTVDRIGDLAGPQGGTDLSRQHAIGGWLIGFLVLPVGSIVLFMTAGITAMVVAAAWSLF